MREKYLNLLKAAVTDTCHQRTVNHLGQIAEVNPSAPRYVGGDWPLFGETMVGIKRLNSLHYMMRAIHTEHIGGDIIECGVWRGGASIFLAGCMEAYGMDHKTLYVCDSFAGLPPPDPSIPQDADMILHTIAELAVSKEEVYNNFLRYDLASQQVEFVKGWFRDTLPAFATLNKQWALIRADGDMYESTRDTLVNLYPNLATGGYIVLDDYWHIPACKAAVDDYRKNFSISEEIIRIDGHGAYWRKGAKHEET